MGAVDDPLEDDSTLALDAPALLHLFHLVLYVLEHQPDHLDDGDDERAKGSGAKVEAEKAIEGAQDCAQSHVALVPVCGSCDLIKSGALLIDLL